eukprot:symbB.v1.2.011067.t1/scaffold738.1/size167167/1
MTRLQATQSPTMSNTTLGCVYPHSGTCFAMVSCAVDNSRQQLLGFASSSRERVHMAIAASDSESDDVKHVCPIRKLIEDIRARSGLCPIDMMPEREMSKAEIELRDLFAMQRMRRLSEESEVELFGPLHTVCESAAEDDDD